jgi:hypothetical protein
MGISNAFNQSIFTQDAYAKAIGNDAHNGYAVLKISPKSNEFTGRKDAEIKGVIKNNLQFNIEATWTELGGVAGMVPDIPILKGAVEAIEGFGNTSRFQQSMGLADRGTKFSSKKIYSRSGFLEIKPEMRIINWNGGIMNSPIVAAMLLANYCIPANAPEGYMKLWNEVVGEKITNYVQTLGNEVIEKFEGIVAAGKTGQDTNFMDKVKTLLAEGARGSAEGIKEAFESYDDNMVLKASPTPVCVKIGNYFSHPDMIITNVQFTMSKEMTENGPLYIDVEISLSSRRCIDNIDYIGMQLPNLGQRVIMDSIKRRGSVNATGF